MLYGIVFPQLICFCWLVHSFSALRSFWGHFMGKDTSNCSGYFCFCCCIFSVNIISNDESDFSYMCNAFGCCCRCCCCNLLLLFTKWVVKWRYCLLIKTINTIISMVGVSGVFFGCSTNFFVKQQENLVSMDICLGKFWIRQQK